MELFDCHLHLQDHKLVAHLEPLLTRAAAAGVSRMFCNGVREEDWPRVLALARGNPRITPFFGLHPWFASGRSPLWLELLGQYLELLPAGIGEIGLDRACRTPLPEQMVVLQAQLALARQRQLPLAIHCVRAWGKLRQALEFEGEHAPGFILHGYGGPLEMVAPLLALGGYFSFSFGVLAPAADSARAALRLVPDDRLLLESDAPYNCPSPDLGVSGELVALGINEPANLGILYTRVAALREVAPEGLARQVVANGRQLLTRLG